MRAKLRFFGRSIGMGAGLTGFITICAYAWMNGVVGPSEMFRLAVMAWAG